MVFSCMTFTDPHAVHNLMSPICYGDMHAFVLELKDLGYEKVMMVDTTGGVFMTPVHGWHYGRGCEIEKDVFYADIYNGIYCIMHFLYRSNPFANEKTFACNPVQLSAENCKSGDRTGTGGG